MGLPKFRGSRYDSGWFKKQRHDFCEDDICRSFLAQLRSNSTQFRLNIRSTSTKGFLFSDSINEAGLTINLVIE
jgi:hypothetical protein